MGLIWLKYGPYMFQIIWNWLVIFYFACMILQWKFEPLHASRSKFIVYIANNGPNRVKTLPHYGPNNLTLENILLFWLHDSSVKRLAISGLWKQRYCINGQNMALIWPKHGPNMVILLGHNIDMSLGPISLSPESFISLVCLESQLQVRLVKWPQTHTLTDWLKDTIISRVVPLWGQLKIYTNKSVYVLLTELSGKKS